jgi:nitroreductase
MTQIIDALNWRYATKAYDTSKKLTEDQVNTLIESVRLSPASFGLQEYRLIHVKDTGTREKLKAAAWGQTQVTDASDLFVFAVATNLNEVHVDSFMQETAKTRNIPAEALAEYAGMIKGSIGGRTDADKIIWLAKQAYIALGVLLSAAATEHIDATPMEGFDCAQFDEILGLKEHNLTSVVMVPVGFRSAEDKYAALAKVRISKENLVIEK